MRRVGRHLPCSRQEGSIHLEVLARCRSVSRADRKPRPGDRRHRVGPLAPRVPARWDHPAPRSRRLGTVQEPPSGAQPRGVHPRSGAAVARCPVTRRPLPRERLEPSDRWASLEQATASWAAVPGFGRAQTQRRMRQGLRGLSGIGPWVTPVLARSELVSRAPVRLPA